MASDISAELNEYLGRAFEQFTEDGRQYLRTPFTTSDGECIELEIRIAHDGSLVLDDVGVTSGLLFSLDQETEGTPGFQLTKSVAESHGLSLDFDRGVIVWPSAVHNGKGTTADGAWSLLQVIGCLQLAIPHLRAPRKERRSLGRRLGRHVRAMFREFNVLKLVDQHHVVRGENVDDWVVDFYYRVPASRRDVYVSAVDLDVAEPREKAEHVITLALDVKRYNADADVRVIYDTHGQNSSSAKASGLIRAYRQLGYDCYDFRSRGESVEFKQLIAQELLPAVSDWSRVFG